MEENRTITAKSSSKKSISAELLKKGSMQLETEIGIIEGWLKDLSGTSDDNSEAISARKNYNDMLQSRQDLLQALVVQKSSH